MSDGTGIQWTDATWNPLRGCSRVSEGCRHCYAETVAKRFNGPGMPYEGLVNAQGRWNGRVKVVEEHLLDPLRWKRPRRVFVNSMSDLFHESVSDETINRIFAVMALSPQHTFQVLTKRPERMRAYMDVLSRYPTDHCWAHALRSFRVFVEGDRLTHADIPMKNVWLGVSVEDQASADVRIPLLLQTPAATRFLSVEPLLGPVTFRRRTLGIGADCDACQVRGVSVDEDGCCQSCGTDALWHGLDWVIVGGESGHGARPCALEWIGGIVKQCRAAAVPVFVKQLGAYVVSTERAAEDRDELLEIDVTRKWPEERWLWRAGLMDRKGGDMSEWPDDLRVREFPRKLKAAEVPA